MAEFDYLAWSKLRQEEEARKKEKLDRAIAALDHNRARWFSRLVRIPPIGRGIALQVVTGMPIPQLVEAIAQADVRSLRMPYDMGPERARLIIRMLRGAAISELRLGAASRGSRPEQHRERATQAMASYLCSTDYTDGRCGPRDGKCVRRGGQRDCIRAATGLFESMVTVGCEVIWVFGKSAPHAASAPRGASASCRRCQDGSITADGDCPHCGAFNGEACRDG
jgi:hypothetical protein